MLESNMFLRYVLGFWIQVIPVALLCYLAFDAEDYRLSVRKTVWINLTVMLLLSVLEAVIWGINERAQGTDYQAAFSSNSTIFYGFLLLCFLLFLACVRSTLVKKLLVFSMGFAYAVFVASGASAYLVYFPDLSFWNTSREVGVMLQGGSIYVIILLECATLPFMALFMRKLVRPVLRVMDTKTSRYYCLTIIIMLMLYCASYTRVTFDFDTVVFVFYCMTLCVFGSFGIFFYTAMQMNKARETEEKAGQLEHQRQLEERNYRRIVGNLQNARMIRHDVRHHLRLIGELAESGNTRAIQDYVQDYDNRILSEATVQISDNHIFNSIYQYYFTKCEENDIELKVQAELGRMPGMSQVDLTVLFSNILENAFNACLKVMGSKRFIDLRVGTVGSSMVIIMKNSSAEAGAEGPLTTADLQYKKKNGSRSLGLQSVQSIVDAHYGHVEYHCGEGVFSTKISIVCAGKGTENRKEKAR